MPYFPDNIPIITDFDPFPGKNQDTSFKTSLDLLSNYVHYVYYYPDGTGTLPDVSFTLEVPNMPEILGNSIYSEFRLHYYESSFRFTQNNGFITFDTLIPELEEINPTNNALVIDGSQLLFDISVSYQNLDAAPYYTGGYFSIPFMFRIIGKKISDNDWHVIENKRIDFSVQKVESDNFYIWPPEVNFNHYFENPSRPEVTVTLETATPVLVTPKEDFELVGPNIPTPYTHLGRIAYPFSSSTTFQVRLKSSADLRLDEVSYNRIVFEVYPSNDYLNKRKSLIADIIISRSSEFVFYPQMLNFLMIIGAENNLQKELTFFGYGEWVIQWPSWLNNNRSNGLHSNRRIFTLIDQDYFTPGVYQNDITLSANGKDYKIPVRLKVAERFELGLSTSGLNFTDDNQLLTKIYNNSPLERYVLVDLEVPQIGYPFATELPKTYEYRLGFFKNETSIHIGEIVKRSLNHLDANQVYNLLQAVIGGSTQSNLIEYYKPSTVSINFKLYNFSDNALVEEKAFRLIRFVTGRNPFFEENLALLRAKNVEQRVTKQSIRLINFVTRTNIVLEVFRNGALYESYIEDISIERLYGLTVDFEDFDIGDEIEYRLYSNAITGSNAYQSQSFIVYPEGKHFHQVVYEDEYRVPQVFDFLGDWQFSSENELIQSKEVINLVEAIQNEKSIKSQALVINTGYIPASNQIFIEQLQNSRLCWLLGNPTEPIIELVPKEYTMVNYDSDQDLYQFEVEFQINPTNDLQNYS